MPLLIPPEQLEEYSCRAKACHADVEAQYWIGYCYWFGTGGVEMDSKEALRIWKRALEYADCANSEDNDDNTGKIRFQLAMSGLGRNPEAARTAVSRLQREAARDDPESQFLLAVSHDYGYFGLDRDFGQALDWYRRAAEYGHVDAVRDIGWCYERGSNSCGLKRDYVQAVEWYEKAAAKGDRHAYNMRDGILMNLSDEGRDRILGCVQRNRWLEHVQRFVKSPSPPPSGLWTLVLEQMATRNQNKWAGLSPIFLCLQNLLVQVGSKKQIKNAEF